MERRNERVVRRPGRCAHLHHFSPPLSQPREGKRECPVTDGRCGGCRRAQILQKRRPCGPAAFTKNAHTHTHKQEAGHLHLSPLLHLSPHTRPPRPGWRRTRAPRTRVLTTPHAPRTGLGAPENVRTTTTTPGARRRACIRFVRRRDRGDGRGAAQSVLGRTARLLPIGRLAHRGALSPAGRPVMRVLTLSLFFFPPSLFFFSPSPPHADQVSLPRLSSPGTRPWRPTRTAPAPSCGGFGLRTERPASRCGVNPSVLTAARNTLTERNVPLGERGARNSLTHKPPNHRKHPRTRAPAPAPALPSPSYPPRRPHG